MSNRKIPPLAKLRLAAPIAVDVPPFANLTAEKVVKMYIQYNPGRVADLLRQHALQTRQAVVSDDDVIGIGQFMHPWVVDDMLNRYANRCLMKHLPFEVQAFIRGAFNEAFFTMSKQAQGGSQSIKTFNFFNERLITSFGETIPIAHSVRSLTDRLLNSDENTVSEMQEDVCEFIASKLSGSNEFRDVLAWPYNTNIESWGMTLGDFAAHVLTILPLICFYFPGDKHSSPYIFNKGHGQIDEDKLFDWILAVPELDAGRLLGAFVSDGVHQALADQGPSLTRTARRFASFHKNFSKLEASAQLFAHQPYEHRIDSALPTMPRLILHSVRPRDQLDFVCDFLSLNGWIKDVDETKRELDMRPYKEQFDFLEYKAAQSLRNRNVTFWYAFPHSMDF